MRDALLAIPSHDIDVAIESTQPDRMLVTGALFAHEVAAVQQELKLPSSTISVVKTNPEKSKHIETAQMTLFGIPVEFCNLRHDEYTKESRVPTVRPGTPLEDALRRDFTVNALFYNLHTQEVEDYTTGLDDLAQGVLRCPLDPTETFLDDPLRLLRGIRFGGQLNCHLDDSIFSCIRTHPEIVRTLHTKLSRERVGTEVQKMLSGNSPSTCIDYMMQLGVFFEVCLVEFSYKKGKGKALSNELESTRSPLDLPRGDPSASAAHAKALQGQVRFMNATLVRMIEDSRSPFFIPKGQDRCIAVLFAILLPLYCRQHDTAEENAERVERLRALCTHGLKLPSIIDATVSVMIDAAQRLASAAPHRAAPNQLTGHLREAAHEALCYLTLDKKTVHVRFFRTVVVGALCVAEDLSAMSRDDLEHLAEQTAQFLMVDEALMRSPIAPLPISTSDLRTVYGLEGKAIGAAAQSQRLLLLHNPSATVSDVLAHLRSEGLMRQ